jgi:YfiH family protein
MRRAGGISHCFTGKPLDAAWEAERESCRSQICRLLARPLSQLTVAKQMHGSAVVQVTSENLGAGGHNPDAPVIEADALTTNRKEAVLLALSADCPLVLVFDPETSAIGLAHAGWRGIVGRIVPKLVASMNKWYGSAAENLLVAVSPSAGPCCYEVGDDVVEIAESIPSNERVFVAGPRRMHFDLWGSVASQLATCGIPDDRIDVAAACSICNHEFYSYRREGPKTGLGGLFACLA